MKISKSLGYHITHEKLLEGIGFDDNIVHNGENELYAEMVMEHFHGYGCHCMPDHAHFIFAGGQGPPQVKFQDYFKTSLIKSVLRILLM